MQSTFIYFAAAPFLVTTTTDGPLFIACLRYINAAMLSYDIFLRLYRLADGNVPESRALRLLCVSNFTGAYIRIENEQEHKSSEAQRCTAYDPSA